MRAYLGLALGIDCRSRPRHDPSVSGALVSSLPLSVIDATVAVVNRVQRRTDRVSARIAFSTSSLRGDNKDAFGLCGRSKSFPLCPGCSERFTPSPVVRRRRETVSLHDRTRSAEHTASGLAWPELLQRAVMAGEAELAAELIRFGADPDAKEPEGAYATLLRLYWSGGGRPPLGRCER